MKILALEREIAGKTAEMFLPYLKAEARRVWELQQSGVLREIWFTAEEHTAVLVLECALREEVEAALESLPLVQANLIAFDVLPLVPYDGYSRLFEKP